MNKEKKRKPSEQEEDTAMDSEDMEPALEPTETSSKEEKTQKMLAEEYLDGWKRCQADFDNYKKRQQESQKELSGYLIEKFLMDILPVMDNFRAATGHVPESEQGSPWVTGIQYIEKQLEKVLEDNGVSVIAVMKGDPFDPAIHEAVEDVSEHEPQDKNSEKGENGKQIVVKVLQNGYRIGERVVRPAKVSVK